MRPLFFGRPRRGPLSDRSLAAARARACTTPARRSPSCRSAVLRGFLIDQGCRASQHRRQADRDAVAASLRPRKTYEQGGRPPPREGGEGRQTQPRRNRRPRGALRPPRRRRPCAGSAATRPARPPGKFPSQRQPRHGLADRRRPRPGGGLPATVRPPGAGKTPEGGRIASPIGEIAQPDQPASDAGGLDDLFGVRYVGPGGKYAAGRLDDAQRKALPDDAPALVQQLALWLPADGRLLWQVAELAAVTGDVATGAAVLDGCVTEFGMRNPELREHRQACRRGSR